MRRYSAFSVAREALRYHKGWGRAWRAPEPKKSYDVVIVAFNDAETLPACLAAVNALKPEPSRIVVVDNASRDDSADIARRAGAEVVGLEENTGFAGGMNHGIKNTNAPWVLLLNPDCAPRPDFVAQLLDGIGARAEVEVKLGEARADAAQLLSEARERAETREREIVEAAKSDAQNMVESARVAIRSEQEKALAAIRSEVVEISLEAASQVLGRNVGSDDDRRLVSELVGTTKAAGE